jgi:hypothetical protein
MRVARWAPALLVIVCVAACNSPSPPSAPTRAPTPTAAAAPVPTLDAAVADVQDAFLTNVNDLTSDVETLATATCADLVAETRANPTVLTEMHGFAATLQRLGASQAMLQSDDVRSALDALAKAITQLDAALATCGIQRS